MPMIAPPLVLRAGDRERLEAVLRASTAPVSLVVRARIVLLAAEGLANAGIAGVLPVFVELEVAVPRSTPAVR